MVYDATVRRSAGAQPHLNEQQVETLARLEQVKNPTEWQRGELAALRMSTPVQQEVERVDALKRHWSGSTPVPDEDDQS